MLTAPFLRNKRRDVKGSALVIVLFFVALLTIVTIAFLSRSLTAVKVAVGSAGETKSKILAASASDIIIGDFKQEIIAGSTNNAGGSIPNSGTVNWPVYTPTSNLTMIPFMDGVPMAGTPATNAIPNLISRSVSPANTVAGGGAAPYTNYPSGYYMSSLCPTNRAASDSTATGTYTSSKVNSATPSLNGRYISPAQWNSHYLIPRNTSVDPAGSTSSDSTPVSTFVPPDWVIITRGGVNTVSSTTPGMGGPGSGGLNDPTLSNTSYAIGRYAYAVYNEGGLLDMNAAGYPADPNLTTSTTPPFYTGTPQGLTPIQSSQKMGLPLADLTQLAAGSVNLTQAQINNIVGWRNYASAELTSSNGSYSSFSFTPASASNWLTNFVLGNTNGFLQIVPPASGVTTPPTDQAFLSRQQLIKVTQSLGMSPDFLQYMGTFSRALEQPSTVPDPNRPKILTTNGSPPSPANVDNYDGNNDQEGNDASGAAHPINPSFLSIRATSAFTRWNGTTAVIGEPLVKTKFALSWLAMVAYNATNTSLPAGFAATASDPDPIYDRFGLYRSSASSPWIYSHTTVTNSDASTPASSILTLDQVAAKGREPDFAELLKAAIIAGSLGKAGPNIHDNQENYQYTLDAQVDFQVIQIMANLIDQYTPDSYPTAIQINNITQGAVTAYGVKDLPYFYRYHVFSVVDRLPTPVMNSNQFSPSCATVTFPVTPGGTTTTATTSMATQYPPSGGYTSASWTANTSSAVTFYGCETTTTAGASLTDPGEATLFYVPELWNPHDPNNVASSTNKRPTNFRIYATTIDPAQITTAWPIGAESTLGAIFYNTVVPESDGKTPPSYWYWPISGGGLAPNITAAPTTWPAATPAASATLMFSDNNGTLFREPTLLWNNNPTGINLSGTGMPIQDANTKQTYYGMIIGKAPISMQVNFSSTPAAQPTDGSYIFQGMQIQPIGGLGPQTISGSEYTQVTFYLQYQDPNNSSNWITYDVKYPEADHAATFAPTLIVDTAGYTNGSWQDPLQNNQFQGATTAMDPRSARWGMGTSATLGAAGENSSGQQASSGVPFVLEPNAYADVLSANFTSMKSTYFSVLEDNRPRVDAGNLVLYSNPGMTSDPNGTFGSSSTTSGFRNLQMRWFSPGEYRSGSGYTSSPGDFDGLFSQNNWAIQSTTISQNGTTSDQVYNEDPDAVARPAMGAYATTNLTSGSSIGLPTVTASTFNNNGVATATSQSQSRPIVLNRPFRSVSEMSYAFRGSPWKNIDFFHPASGDSALLDTFCLTEPPANAMVAGKVDLNTRQIPVLQAIVAGAYRDEVNNSSASPPSYALPPLNGTEALNVATTLEKVTSDTTDAWRGPLKNISGLVGRYVATPATAPADTDIYTYAPPNLASSSSGGAPGTTTLPAVSYAGLSSALDCSSFFGAANHVYSNTVNSANVSAPLIQRFREAAIRPLVATGQVRVWNLLIDVVAQTGHYPKTATGLDQFYVDGQTRLWVHVAIDRLTGQVIDKQVEVVTP